MNGRLDVAGIVIVSEDYVRKLYRLGDKIGSGTFSHVVKAMHMPSKQEVIYIDAGGHKDHR